MTEIPTAMTCCALNSLRIRKTVINLSNLNLIIGDATGKIHIIALHPEFGVSADVGMKKKNQILFAESVKVWILFNTIVT